MRTRNLLAALALAAGGLTATASPAAAYCDPLFEELFGTCTNLGCVVAAALERADDTQAKITRREFIEAYCPM